MLLRRRCELVSQGQTLLTHIGACLPRTGLEKVGHGGLDLERVLSWLQRHQNV